MSSTRLAASLELSVIFLARFAVDAIFELGCRLNCLIPRRGNGNDQGKPGEQGAGTA